MLENDKKIQFIKNTLGTREKYHEIITNHSFTNFEKDILLQASVNIKSSNIDESLINVTYDILISKSIVSIIEKEKPTTNSSLLKYLLIIGFFFVVFYVLTLNNSQEIKKVEVANVVKFGNISGQGFLRTKGGSIRTCAGIPVHLEKSNRNGFLFLSETLQNKKDHLEHVKWFVKLHEDSLSDSIDSLKFDKDRLTFHEDNLKFREDSLKFYARDELMKGLAKSTKDSILRTKKAIIEEKKEIIEDKKEIAEAYNKIALAKNKVVLAKKEILSYEEKVNNSTKDNILKTICDAQGNYSFPKVELGKYYIRTVVQWYVGDEKQGGIISKTITIQEGKNTVMLTE